MSRDHEKETFDAIDRGNWEQAIEHAKQVPSSYDIWQRLPTAQAKGMPDHAVKLVLDELEHPYSRNHKNLSSFLHEMSSHLHHKSLSPSTLRRLARLTMDHNGFYEQSKLLLHPNFDYDEKMSKLKLASEFWRSYERKVSPHHFAAVKSIMTGQPESIKDHRSEIGKSHGEGYIHSGKLKSGIIHSVLPDLDLKNLRKRLQRHEEGHAIKLEDIMPHLNEYSQAVQDKITNDQDIPKRIINGKQYIKLYRGLNGDYGRIIRDKVNHDSATNHVDKKSLIMPTAPFSSWTTDPKVAAQFTWMRDNLPNQKHNRYSGVVVSKWMPIDNIMHSGFHSVVPGQEHAHPSEKEIVVSHPEGKIKVSTNEMYFQPSPQSKQKEFSSSHYGEVKRANLRKDELDLEKGLHGDWKKEGYTISHSVHDTPESKKDPTEGDFVYVRAHSPKGKEVGSAKLYMHGKTLSPSVVEVHPQHQRKGLASAMYQHIERHTGRKIMPDPDSWSVEGESLWSQPKRQFGKSEDLEKGFKTKMAGLATVASMLGVPYGSTTISPAQSQTPSMQLEGPELVSPHKDLEPISYIESRNGKQMSHPTVTWGLNSGTRAIGLYGLMPITVHETAKKDPTVGNTYPQLKRWDPIKDHKMYEDFLAKHPTAQHHVANSLWGRLRRIFGKDKDRAVYAWNNGVTGAKTASSQDIINHPYVKEYHKYQNMLKLQNNPTKINKSEFQVPNHFSMISAQRNDKHNQSKHEALHEDLKEKGFEPIEVVGHYGYTEKSFLVPHSGSAEDRHKIEDLGRHYKQESVLHSSNLKNHLVHLEDSSKSAMGEGHSHDYSDQMFTELPGGQRLKLNFKKAEDLEKAKLNNKQIATHWMTMAYGEPHRDDVDHYTRSLGRMGHSKWELHQIPVADIESHHSGHDKSGEYVQDFVDQRKQGSEFPPIIIHQHPEKKDKFQTIDGQHRLMAAKILGQSHINAFVPVETFKKAEDDYLYHYSRHQDPIQIVDPQFHGTGTPGAESKRGVSVARAYYYDTPVDHEPLVQQGSKHMYKVKHPGKVLDIASNEAQHLVNKARNPYGILELPELERHIKEAGYNGYKNSAGHLPNAVALFYPQPVHKELSLQKTEELAKGVKQRLWPYNPAETPIPHKEDVDMWIDASQTGFAPQSRRESMPRLEGNARMRAMHSLSGNTKTRWNPETKEREFLLHRGMSGDEYHNNVDETDESVSHPHKTSWTPKLMGAVGWMENYGDIGESNPKVASAWIPESKIHHIPLQIGSVTPPGVGPSERANEYEVVVDPGTHQLAHKDDVKSADPTEKPSDINAKISRKLASNEYIFDDLKKYEPQQNVTKFESFSEDPGDMEIIRHINTMIDDGKLHKLKEEGAFTFDSFIAGTNPDDSWLIKVEPTNKPGIKAIQDTGPQSVKEAAFYDTAKNIFGLGQFIPKSILGTIHYENQEPKLATAIKMLPADYENAAEFDDEHHGAIKGILSKYHKSGLTHMLALMLYVLGDLDAHGNNVMTNGKDISLIDHGSSFADLSAEARDDKKQFIPYILRRDGFKKKMSSNDKKSHMPIIDDPTSLRRVENYILSLDPKKLYDVIISYGLNPNPAVTRLKIIKDMVKNTCRPDIAINFLWVDGSPKELLSLHEGDQNGS